VVGHLPSKYEALSSTNRTSTKETNLNQVNQQTKRERKGKPQNQRRHLQYIYLHTHIEIYEKYLYLEYIKTLYKIIRKTFPVKKKIGKKLEQVLHKMINMAVSI
jgi:hypothetical protein